MADISTSLTRILQIPSTQFGQDVSHRNLCGGVHHYHRTYHRKCDYCCGMWSDRWFWRRVLKYSRLYISPHKHQSRCDRPSTAFAISLEPAVAYTTKDCTRIIVRWGIFVSLVQNLDAQFLVDDSFTDAPTHSVIIASIIRVKFVKELAGKTDITFAEGDVGIWS